MDRTPARAITGVVGAVNRRWIVNHLSVAERNLLLLVVVLLAVSGIARWSAAGPAPGFDAGGEADPVADDLRDAVAEERRREEVRSRPLEAGERIALDRASADELQRVPGIGPVTARRIVAWREARGGIGAVDELSEVPGVGEATLGRIRPHLGIESPSHVSSPAAITTAVDVNRADVEELQSLPGIGPALAERIVRSRVMEGPFRDLADLTRVSGIGVSTATRLDGRVEFGTR